MKANDSLVGRFLGNSGTVFVIPPFQRNYSWDEEQCGELFDDILDATNTNKSHYIGNIVYYFGDNSIATFSELVLIDGQQRITSILLLLCALRTKLLTEESKRLEKKFLLNEDEDDEKYRVKLKQTGNDSRVFEKIIDFSNSNFSVDEKQSRLYKNYTYFVERCSELEDSRVGDFYNTITKLQIVDVNLQVERGDLEIVQNIFEKINSTGKPLTAADLIRNYLLITNNVMEQRKLYDNYWVKIEDQYQDKEKISDFAKYYLIIKRCTWVEEDRMYNTFKSYFNNSELSKKDILDEMLKYSKYYNWFVNEDCQDEEINVILKEFNVLKSSDMYSLLLVLFDLQYENNKNELKRVLNLLCDFMIRYRIVSPSNGSADIRKTIFSILEKVTHKEIEINCNVFLKELSNSPSPGGRFPNDDEFRESLNGMVNISYAKALLYKLDYKVANNNKVDIKKVTVEHLMPQTLSEDWKNYLGGQSNAETIYNTYINNIGNLALLSRPMNSSNSNSLWENKITNLDDASFKLTNSITQNQKWKAKWDDGSIKDRCKYITELSLKYIIGPKERERPFEVAEVNDEFSAGIYKISSIDFSVTGKSVSSLIVDGKVLVVKTWGNLLPSVCKKLIEVDNGLFDTVVRQNRIHKSTSKRNYYYGQDPLIAVEDCYVQKAIKIEGTNYFVETNLAADRALKYTQELIRIFGLSELFEIELE